MTHYQALNELQAPCNECFFAFSKSQFEEGRIKNIPEGKEVLSAAKTFSGLYGTKEGINDFLGFYVDLDKRIKEECEPQEVYDYEFVNHECDYVGDDAEAIRIVVSLFGREKATEVNRRYAYIDLEQVEKDNL